jgi:hypothetical protein
MIIGDIKNYLQRIENRLASIESYISEIRYKNAPSSPWEERETEKNKRKFFEIKRKFYEMAQQAVAKTNGGSEHDRY